MDNTLYKNYDNNSLLLLNLCDEYYSCTKFVYKYNSKNYYVNNYYLFNEKEDTINLLYVNILFLYRHNNIPIKYLPTIDYIHDLYISLPDHLKSIYMIYNILTTLNRSNHLHIN